MDSRTGFPHLERCPLVHHILKLIRAVVYYHVSWWAELRRTNKLRHLVCDQASLSGP